MTEQLEYAERRRLEIEQELEQMADSSTETSFDETDGVLITKPADDIPDDEKLHVTVTKTGRRRVTNIPVADLKKIKKQLKSRKITRYEVCQKYRMNSGTLSRYLSEV